MRWVTYWFRLQNTTLFFYTKKNGSATHLRGYYYIFTVQSVRGVQRSDSKRFMFEIIMTSGKRKVLAAETAALRKEWVGNLWEAMHLSASRVSDSSTHLRVCEQRERLNSSLPIGSQSDSVMESLPARPLSAPAPTGRIHHDVKRVTFPVYLPEEPNSEEAVYQNTLPACNCQLPNDDSVSSPHVSTGLSSAEGRREGDYDVLPLRKNDSVSSPHVSTGLSSAEGRQEGDYDVLPLRKKICAIDTSTEMDEGIYDFPISYSRAAERPNPTESIYDVPSSLLMKSPGQT